FPISTAVRQSSVTWRGRVSHAIVGESAIWRLSTGRTGKRTWLYNPRRQKWSRHFRWSGALLLGRTAVGRATINLLGINLPHQVALRAELILEGVFPLP